MHARRMRCGWSAAGAVEVERPPVRRRDGASLIMDAVPVVSKDNRLAAQSCNRLLVKAAKDREVQVAQVVSSWKSAGTAAFPAKGSPPTAAFVADATDHNWNKPDRRWQE